MISFTPCEQGLQLECRSTLDVESWNPSPRSSSPRLQETSRNVRVYSPTVPLSRPPTRLSSLAFLCKPQATRFCEEVKASRDGWRLALEVFCATTRLEARFFSLGCLQDALGGRAGASVRVETQQDRRAIREAIMGWMKAGSGAELESQETFIRTKASA